MASALSGKLGAARRRRFVGRQLERDMFVAALSARESPFYVLHVFGPGGVGKTTLLRQFAADCEANGAVAVFLDARSIEPTPEGFVAALTAANADALRPSKRRRVIFVDTYEVLSPLDSWLRERFLPQLSDNTLTVLAGRKAPSAGWRTDPDWQGMVKAWALRNLAPDETRAFLAQRNIPPNQHEAVLAFTYGHPLALTLVAETFAQRDDPARAFKPEDAPDVIKTLLEQFVQKVPGPAHRAALEACALVHVLTEPLLAAMLKSLDAHELFEWLRDLTFIESGRFGVFPHDLAREALCADLKWRNPDWYAELHARARTYYTSHLNHTSHDQRRLLLDLIYLHRDNAVVKQALDWQVSGSILTDVAQAEDLPAIVQMVNAHEGPESARLAAQWFSAQPRAFIVFRDESQHTAGFVAALNLTAMSDAEREADPATRAAWAAVQRAHVLRPGDICAHFRWWMARDSYQAVSPLQSLCFVTAVHYYLTTPQLAYHFFTVADAAMWQPVFAYAELDRTPAADFDMDGKGYGVYAHNWRAMPPAVWLDVLAKKELGLTASDAAKPPDVSQLVALSEPDFSGAAKEALRDLNRPQALRANPLMCSRIVLDPIQPRTESQRLEALRKTLLAAIDALNDSPRDVKFYRALYHTYVKPAPSQEKAAEILDVPFSTYRRHLQTGIERVTETLWQKELA